MPHPDSEHLHEYAAGSLPAPLALDVGAHLEACAACARSLAAIEEVVTALPLALAPTSPPSALRARLLGDALPGARFERFAPVAAEMLAAPREEVLSYFPWIDDPARWRRGPGGSHLLMLAGGPRRCLLRIAAGAEFPRHRHLGEERVLIMQGAYEDGGVVYTRGAEARQEPGSEHALRALPGIDCVCLVIETDDVVFVT